MRPIYLMFDSGIDKFERDAAVAAVLEAAKIFRGRECFILGTLIDSIVRRASTVRKSLYGEQKDVGAIHSAVTRALYYRPSIGVVLVSKDLTAKMGEKYLNFCFGFTSGSVTVQSVARFRDLSDSDREIMIKGTIQHELGHVFNLAGDSRRTNTEYNLGMHCTNPGCVMNQGLTREALLERFKLARKMGRIYCPQCRFEAAKVHY